MYQNKGAFHDSYYNDIPHRNLNIHNSEQQRLKSNGCDPISHLKEHFRDNWRRAQRNTRLPNSPRSTSQCIIEIKNSRQFPKEISIRADTVAKHKTPKVAHTHLKYSLATPIHHSFVRRERFDTNLPFGKKIDTRRGHISIPGVVDGVS